MAHHQLQHPDEAKQWLAKAVKQIEATKDPSWENKLRWSLLRAEAEKLIEGK